MRRDLRLTIAIGLALGAAALLLHTNGLEIRRLAARELPLSSCGAPGQAAVGPPTAGFKLFVECSDGIALPPFPVYASLVARDVWPAPPQRIRLVPAIVGAVNVVLIYCLAFRIFRATAHAAVAALLLLASPAHLTFSRWASADGVWVLPFVLLWAFAIAAMPEGTPGTRRRTAAAATMTAGLSVYAQPSAPLLALSLLLLTMWVGVRLRLDRRDWVPSLAALTVVMMPTIVWMTVHPASYADTFGRSLLHLAHIRNPIDWMAALTNWQSLTSASSVFWDFFNPSHLFMDENSPALAAVFLLPTAVPVALGVRAAVGSGPDVGGQRMMLRVACAASILTALTVALFKEPRAMQRGLAVVVFGALLGTAGVQRLAERRTMPARLALVAILTASVLQFSVWYLAAAGPAQDP